MIFLSTFANKVDSKGRISIPSPFRNVISNENSNQIIAYPSFVNQCIEACSISRMNKLAESIDEMDPYSEERDSFATAILGGCEQINIDKDGRIILPKNLTEYAEIGSEGVFVGKGKTFEIWNSDKFKSYQEKAVNLAKEKRGILKLARNEKEILN